MLSALARLIAAHAKLVLAASVVLVIAAGAFGGPVVGMLDSGDDFDDPASESHRAHATLTRASGREPAPDVVVLVRAADQAGKVERVEAAMRALPGLGTVGGPVRSEDGRSAYLTGAFAIGATPPGETLEALEALAARDPGVVLGGGEIAGEQVGEQVQEDLARAEMLAFPLLFALSLFVFRGVVAALVPIVVGGATILVTFAALRTANAIEPMSVFAVNLVTGLGLGLAIDYSLFMVSRFREELARAEAETGAGAGAARGKGASPAVAAALAATLRTAGRTVLFSALTVAAALAALLVFPLRFLFSMGVGGVAVALAAALVSLTLLPALLAVLGPRVNALAPRRWQLAAERDAAGIRGGFWYRLSQAVMRRPAPIAIGVTLLLVVLGLPFTRIEFTGVDASVLPPERSARVVSDALERDFAADDSSPSYLAVHTTDEAAIGAYAQRLGRLDGAVRVQAAPAPKGGWWRIDVVGDAPALSERSQALVDDIRAVPAPAGVLVGGQAAALVDRLDSLRSHLPRALALLCTSTLVILFCLTGSLILPFKTLLMNFLTVSAAFGILVLIFQDGRLETLLDYSSQSALEASQPILLFATAFGLSTDYGVFLLTRIKEARDSGLSDREAVAVGLERTGRIVSFAAILFCVAIGAFATSEIVFIKELGVGTGLAVLIDATIVRALLVPSLMALLGRWNWWAPRPLARAHARLGLSEG
jgi:RND superfamily putative drug exporter